MPNSSGPNNSPVLYYITGPSGGGKSTFAAQSRFADHFDRDQIVKQVLHNNIPIQAQRLADRAEIDFWDKHLEEKQSFSTERPLNYRSSLDWIQEAKDAGFHTDVAFIAAGDAETHIQRVHRRIARGDHAVADAEIRSIHKRSMENLPLLLNAASTGSIDNVRIYDNQAADPQTVLHIENGKTTFLSQPAPAWLSQALERSPFTIPQLQTAMERGLTLADLDPARELRSAALAKQLTPPLAFEYLDIADMYGSEVISEDMNEARARLLQNAPPGEVVRDIAASHGYSGEIREYADTLVDSVETQLAPELEGIAAARFNPTIARHGPLRFWQEETADYTIKHAAGQLTVPDAKAIALRDLAAQRAVSRGTGDHAGHLIAHQFGGPEIAANLGLQNHIQNQGGGTYWQLEKQWAEALQHGITIDVHVQEMTRTGEDRAAYRNVEWAEIHPDGKTVRETLAFMNATSPRSREATGKPVIHYDTPAQVFDLHKQSIEVHSQKERSMSDTVDSRIDDEEYAAEQRTFDPKVAAEIETVQQRLRRTQEQFDREAPESGQDTEQGIDEEKGKLIAVRLTEDQIKLLLSSEYPNDGQKQNTALANIYNGDEEINVFNETVQLDHSDDEQTYFAILEQNEKPALDAKLTQLQRVQEREKEAQQEAQDPRQRERTRERSRERY